MYFNFDLSFLLKEECIAYGDTIKSPRLHKEALVLFSFQGTNSTYLVSAMFSGCNLRRASMTGTCPTCPRN